MRICVTTELRVERTPDGGIWTKSAMPYDFWRRYLTVFDEVRVIARVHDVCEADIGWRRADGEQVKFFPVPYYVGPSEYIRKRYYVGRAVRAGISQNDAIIFRVGSPIAACAKPLVRNGRPHGLEVIGDPYEVYAQGSVDHPFRPFFRVWFSAQLRRQCRAASAVAFVTERTLQHRYPPSPTGFATHYSSVELPEAAFAAAPKRFSHLSGALVRIVSVGPMEQRYKGFDVLIDALALCLQRGLQLELVLVGDGRYRKELIQHTTDLGIADAVTFRGNLPAGPSVRAELDRAHIFVLVSKTEGLPRAMIEAMARGLACIGSSVGGIPELLPQEDLVPAGDAYTLAHKIEDTVRDCDRMNRMAERNLSRARDYHDFKVNARRVEFLKVLRNLTEAWNST